MKTNPDSREFLDAIRNLEVGDTVDVDDGQLVIIEKFTVPTHFRWHQRIFEPGIILQKPGTNIRIYVEAEKIGMQIENAETFEDKQIDSAGNVLPPIRDERN